MLSCSRECVWVHDTHACMRKRTSVHMWKRWKQAWMLLCFEFVLYKVWGILLKIGKWEICSSLNIMFADEHFRHFMATSPATTTIISSPSDLPSYLLSSRHESNVVCAVLLWKMLSDPVKKNVNNAIQATVILLPVCKCWIGWWLCEMRTRLCKLMHYICHPCSFIHYSVAKYSPEWLWLWWWCPFYSVLTCPVCFTERLSHSPKGLKSALKTEIVNTWGSSKLLFCTNK